jgi:hypothetical protein
VWPMGRIQPQRPPRDKLETRCIEFVAHSSRVCRGQAVSSLEPVSGFSTEETDTDTDGFSVRRVCLELVGLLDAVEFCNSHDKTRQTFVGLLWSSNQKTCLCMTSSADVKLVWHNICPGRTHGLSSDVYR